MKVSWFRYVLVQVDWELPCHRHPLHSDQNRGAWCMSRTCEVCVFSEYTGKRAIAVSRIRKIEL